MHMKESDNTFSSLIQEGRSLRSVYPDITTSPEQLLEVFLSYLDIMESRFWVKQEVIKSGPFAATLVGTDLTVMLSFQTFTIFSGITQKWIQETASRDDDPMQEVCILIEASIEGQQIEGAAIGAFNVSLVQRLQALAEKQDPDSNLRMSIEQITGMKVL